MHWVVRIPSDTSSHSMRVGHDTSTLSHQLFKGHTMKLKQAKKHKHKQVGEGRPPKEIDRDPEGWLRSMKATTKFIRLRRYILNDFYFNKKENNE